MPVTKKEDADGDDVRDRSLHRHGTPDPSKWDESLNKTAREQMSQESTFATRKAARSKSTKAVKSAENKAVKSDDTK